jgi:MFS family permease
MPGASAAAPENSRIAVPLLGVAQIVSWGSSYYLLAVLAGPISADTGWPAPWVVAGGSVGLLASGLAGPLVGRLITNHGGRPTMAFGSVLMAAGLLAVGAAPNLTAYLLGWAVLGLGMGAGLYDAAFSTLGRIFGGSARRAIAGVTLFGGFASTICWPLSALAVEHLGWRGACFAYAAAQAFVMAPMLLALLPREARKAPTDAPRGPQAVASVDAGRGAFWLLAAILMVNGAVQTAISVHLLTMLQAQGLSLAAAVAIGALIGPGQVAARIMEIVFGARLHPTVTLLGAAALVGLGMALLVLGPSLASVAILLYAAGNGVWSIARGTVPLALFGADRFALIMGRLAAPNLMVQAAAPFAAGLLISAMGSMATIVILAAAAAANVALAGLLARLVRG